jgi:hypothetical protein
MSKKHLFTVRMLDAAADYITHREHIAGRAGIEAYKKEVANNSLSAAWPMCAFTTKHSRLPAMREDG